MTGVQTCALPIFTVDMANGIVVGDPTLTGTDTLRHVEGIRGSWLADTYNATGFGSSSLNAGSSGTYNEFEGNGGDDTIIGNGNTRLSFYQARSGVTVNFTSNEGYVNGTYQGASGTATGDASVGTDTFSGVSGANGSFFDDTFIGSNNPNGSSEWFRGNGGNDYIDGRGGLDGSDYHLAEVSGVAVNMAAGIVTGDFTTGADTLRSIEMIQGSDFSDVYDATGFGANSVNAGSNGTWNQFQPFDGDDTIFGNNNTQIGYWSSTSAVNVVFTSNNAGYADGAGSGQDRKSTRLNSSHIPLSRMPSSA